MLNNIFEDCDNQASILKRIIDIENEYAPEEMGALMEACLDYPKIAQQHIKKNINWMMKGHQTIRPYKRIKISENINYFRAPLGGVKSLLLCFCGNADRLMMPTSTLLQHIPEDAFDILMLCDPSRKRYLAGVPGYADQIGAVLSGLQQDISFSQYRDIRCLGTSAGGAIALYSAIFLGAKRALSVGGVHPSISEELEQFKAEGVTGSEFDDLIKLQLDTSSQVELLAFFGDQIERDFEGGSSLKRYLPQCRLGKVHNIETHNVFFRLFERGQFTQFLQRYLFADSIA